MFCVYIDIKLFEKLKFDEGVGFYEKGFSSNLLCCWCRNDWFFC